MAKFKEGDRVIIGEEPGFQEAGTVQAVEDPKYPGMYIVTVDKKIDEHDDRLREVHVSLMKPMEPIILGRESIEDIWRVLYNICSLGHFPEELDQPKDPKATMERLDQIRIELEEKLHFNE